MIQCNQIKTKKKNQFLFSNYLYGESGAEIYKVPLFFLKTISTYHFSIERVIESFQQLDHCALPTATTSHKSQRLSLVYCNLQSLEHWDIWPGWIIEGHILEGNVAAKSFLELKRQAFIFGSGWATVNMECEFTIKMQVTLNDADLGQNRQCNSYPTFVRLRIRNWPVEMEGWVQQALLP